MAAQHHIKVMGEIHAFISGFGDGFYQYRPDLEFKHLAWIMAEYHYYAVGRIFGALLPFAITLGIGVFLGSLI